MSLPQAHAIEAPTRLLIVTTTVGTEADARALAHALVNQRLAACAQIERIDSVYRWEGAVQQDAEWRLVFKTTRALYPQVEQAIRALHRYTLPAIHAVAVEAASADYAAWVIAETRQP